MREDSMFLMFEGESSDESDDSNDQFCGFFRSLEKLTVSLHGHVQYSILFEQFAQ